ncbi:CCA-adding enzyme [bioreactor metagenome]|uniref:CCA-adding enzyme n=1 Tax=bioreactor metagenome TaxID=1076179 RepID=A0A645F5L2_9ZZZZ
MRALRFSSFYQFAIEEKTAQAIHQHSGLLKKISQERITAELLKLLSGADCAKVIETYFDVIVQILPEFMVLAPAQATKYLPYLTRTDQSIIRLMIFLKVLDEAQDELFPSALRRLRLSNRVSRRLKLLHHFSYAALQIDRISLKRLLKETDVSGVQDIAAYQHAVGLVTDEESGRIMAIVKSIRQNNECYSLKQLAVNGNDIRMLVGADTPQIKEVLDSILMLVIEEKAVNDHEVLIMKAAELLKKDVNND